MKTLHLFPNAHLDSVWLWDWREGLNEGIATCRSMIKLMKEFPDLTFIRGESSIYEHVEKYDPESFEEIRKLVKEGRWEIVGGNYVQPDTNIPCTEALIRQYEIGKDYFRKKFGVEVETAWAPDSFGHAAGFPDVYAQCGLRYFVFTRPVKPLMPDLTIPVFRWRGLHENHSVLTLFDRISHCYCSGDRFGLTERLDHALEESRAIPMDNIALFFGMGDHGGGVSRREVQEILEWREKHAGEIEVRFSTFGRFFKACEAEKIEFPEYKGEINFCLRGCTASALRVKSAYRRAEAALIGTERIAKAVAEKLHESAPDLTKEWKDLLFNQFHDILPGTAIDRALTEQQDWMRGLLQRCRELNFDAMNRFATSIPVAVKEPGWDLPEALPFLIWNSRPEACTADVELEECIDWRPIGQYGERFQDVPCTLLDESGKPIPFQLIPSEHDFNYGMIWRERLVTRLDFPANGYRLVTFGYTPDAGNTVSKPSKVGASEDSITNGSLTVRAKAGDSYIQITRDGKPVIADKGIEFATFRDVYGSWGDTKNTPDGSCPERLENWKIETVKALASGPETASMFMVIAGGRSQIRMKISLYRDSNAVRCSGTLIWQERACRLKMLMSPVKEAVYQTVGGVIRRELPGDVPCGRWMKRDDGWGIASDVFCSFASQPDYFSLTLVRGNRSASLGSDDFCKLEQPITDYGAHDFQLVFAPDNEIEEEAEKIAYPPVALRIWSH